MHQKSNLHIIDSSILSDFSTDSNTKGSEHASNGSNHESCLEAYGTIPFFPVHKSRGNKLIMTVQITR